METIYFIDMGEDDLCKRHQISLYPRALSIERSLKPERHPAIRPTPLEKKQRYTGSFWPTPQAPSQASSCFGLRTGEILENARKARDEIDILNPEPLCQSRQAPFRIACHSRAS